MLLILSFLVLTAVALMMIITEGADRRNEYRELDNE
jgi:hypothetical protein